MAPLSKIRRYFITGLVALLPLGVTAFIAWFFISKLGGMGSIFLKYIPGIARLPQALLTVIGFIIFILFLVGVGAVTSGLFGRWFFPVMEKFFSNLPFLKGIYTSTRQLTDAVLVDQKSLKQVVFVEYTRKGVFMIGFITQDGEIDLGRGRKGLTIFLPSTPNPTTGWLTIVPADEVYPTTLSVDEGLKMIVSGGVVTPEKLKKFS